MLQVRVRVDYLPPFTYVYLVVVVVERGEIPHIVPRFIHQLMNHVALTRKLR